MDYNKPQEYILIVEDSPIDYEIAMRALKKVDFDYEIMRCADGDHALELLLGDNDTVREKGHPRMILLDLNLPGTDGRDVLEQLKASKHARHIPVVILSTSNNEKDVETCYDKGANCYVQKPTSPDDYVIMAQALKNFWFEWASLPKGR